MNLENMTWNFKFKTLKEQYEEHIILKLFPDRRVEFSKEDLTDNEKIIIEVSYEMFQEKLEDIKILNDEIKRLSVENANLKAYNDDRDYEYDDEK